MASVYRQVRDMISLELDVAELDEGVDFGFGDLPERPSWRERAIAAGQEVGIENLPAPDDQDFDHWDLLIESLEGRVLWDDDWDMIDHLDAPPEVAIRIKAKLGISDDYFIAIPVDPSDAEAERLLAVLMMLTKDA